MGGFVFHLVVGALFVACARDVAAGEPKERIVSEKTSRYSKPATTF